MKTKRSIIITTIAFSFLIIFSFVLFFVEYSIDDSNPSILHSRMKKVKKRKRCIDKLVDDIGDGRTAPVSKYRNLDQSIQNYISCQIKQSGHRKCQMDCAHARIFLKNWCKGLINPEKIRDICWLSYPINRNSPGEVQMQVGEIRRKCQFYSRQNSICTAKRERIVCKKICK